MSNATQNSPPPGSIPNWLAGTVIGLMIGAGGVYIGSRTSMSNAAIEDSKLIAMPGGTVGMGAPSGTSTTNTNSPSGATGGLGNGMGGAAAGMMAGGGGMMGGGGARAKRTLTSLVGRVELLTRNDLHIQLTAEQAKQIAAKLAALENAEKMTNDEAQAEAEALENLLTDEQKAVLDSIGLPFGRQGGAGAPGAGGPGAGGPGAGGPGAGGPGARGPGAGGPATLSGGPSFPLPPGMAAQGGAGGGAEDENPFKQEANQKRLQDLLTRIGAGAEG